MGTVYLANDVRLGRRIALKFIDADHYAAPNADAQQQLMHEARAASGLNHPNICQVYDVGGEGRESWIAMEYVEGESLAARLRARGRLTADETVRNRSPAGRRARPRPRARHSAPRSQVRQRRVRSGRPPKILDFGIARRLVQDASEATRSATHPASSAIEGTLPYMAPEVIRGEPQDERADLWSLGVVLFELLAGRRPFDGRNSYDLAAQITQGPAVQLPEGVPAPLAHVIGRLLSRDPASRYATAAETAAALEAVGDHTGPVSPRPRRARAVAGVVVVIVGLAVAAAVLLRRETTLRVIEQRLVSSGGMAHRTPSYSPDGSMLAYAAPDAMGVQQIWVQTLAQGSTLQITSGKNSASRPRWLSRTNQILFAVAGQGLGPLRRWAERPRA